MKSIARLISLTTCLIPCIAIAASEITLSGRYEYRSDNESQDMIGDFVCFFPEADSAKRLPRAQNDKRMAWFCFANKTGSKNLLGISEAGKKSECGLVGTATVQITAYQPSQGEGDDFDTAQLQAVLNSTKPQTLSCK